MIKTGRVEGLGTLSSSDCQQVSGRYNVEDTHSQYAAIVGNGESDIARSNAYTLDWDGNASYAGYVRMGADPTNPMDAASKQYVDSLSVPITNAEIDEICV